MYNIITIISWKIIVMSVLKKELILRRVIILVCLVVFTMAFFRYDFKSEETIKNINEKKLPIYCVDKKEKEIALTFDCAWGNENTSNLLKILRENNVKVTFFMTGGWIDKYPNDVKNIYKEGHDLGNHSEKHKQMSKLSKDECIKEIKTPHDKVKKLIGYDMKFFRPPFGDYNNNLIETLSSLGYNAIQWSVDSLDWKDYSADIIVQKVTKHKRLDKGAIILCHNGAKHTSEALDDMIKILKDKGYKFVPLSKLIYIKDAYVDNEGKQFQKEN